LIYNFLIGKNVTREEVKEFRDMHNFYENSSLEKQISVLIKSLLKIAADSTVKAELSEIDHYVSSLESALKIGEFPTTEKALLNLYIRLHGAGSLYSPQEREILTERKGYSCYPGGLIPLIKAAQFIRPDSIVADLGAGNGLQGLLLQCLCPHQKTIQIEISSEMIRIGRIFQQAIGISADRIEWIHDDIVNASIETADFIYLYLPAKPLDGGEKVYEAIARKVSKMNRLLAIFSVADCLAKFIDKHFSVSYMDGHLTCFVRK
jgi:hypothetical protein